MAYGEIKVSGADVLEALTYCNAASKYERLLNDDGERLADMIAERVLSRIKNLLYAQIPTGNE